MVCLTPEELHLERDTFALSYGSKVSCPTHASSLYHQLKGSGIATWGFLRPKISPYDRMDKLPAEAGLQTESTANPCGSS